MDPSAPQPAQLPRKVVLWLIAILLLGIAAGESPALYHFAKARIFLERARRAPNSSMAMQWGVQSYMADQKYLPTVEFLADLNEKEGSTQSLPWRMRAAQLKPEDTEILLKWAKAALVAGKTEMAVYALDLIPEKKRTTAAYHSLMAARFLQAGQRKEAEHHFAEALRLEPGNILYAVNQATYALESPDSDTSRKASEQLSQWEETPQWGLNASRALLNRDLRLGNREQAWKRSALICKNEAAGINDWLLFLTSTRAFRPEDYKGTLVQVQTWLLKHPRDIPAWMNWARINGEGKDAVEWTSHLPDSEKKAVPLRMAIADIRVSTGEWETLEKELQGETWGEFEFSRRLLLVRSLRERSMDDTAAWNAAWSELKDKPVNLLLASYLLISWKWEKETEMIWWRIGQISDQYRELAWGQLMARYQKLGDTRGLLLLALKKLDAQPEDPVAQNNYAFLALLLNQDEKRAGSLATRVYQKYPLHPASVTTYALFLYREGRLTEGLDALNRLSPEQKEDPGIALYEGLLLAANQKPEKAQQSFAKASKGTFLPEEKALMKQYSTPTP